MGAVKRATPTDRKEEASWKSDAATGGSRRVGDAD
jgi:hypothetical protein